MKLFPEKVLKELNCYQPTDDKDIFQKLGTQKDIGLEDKFIFCSFNILIKYNRYV